MTKYKNKTFTTLLQKLYKNENGKEAPRQDFYKDVS